ncbi:MAG: choice-of-anchor Q domain-containing protein, partial [Candidatus Roseilinea sp.]|uniref:choice-of-anchor Q domain-containing protein n=1 Tax=Candidatus Roseilinea sp. TaxID=2838777 RepID=UPI00404954EF
MKEHATNRSLDASPLMIRKLCAGLAAAAGALALSAATASAATITVTTGADEFGTNPTACSLREAIQSANSDTDFGGCAGTGMYGNDTIVFDPAVTLVQLSIVGPGPNNDDNSFLDLDILDTNPSLPNDLIIDGGASGVTIQPLALLPWADRIFDIPQNPGGQPGAVELRNLTIQGGGFPGSETGGGNPCFNSGGGVRNWSGGPLTLSNVTIQNNVMPLNGGGVCQQTAGNLSISGSTIRNNVATNFNGGGVAYFANSTLSIQNSTVLSNTAYRAGGGIYDQSDSMTIQDSQVLSNTVNGPSSFGGGVWTGGGVMVKQILNSTVAYNRADGDGGGVYNQTTPGLQLIDSTVLSNTAGAFLNNPGNGGGIWSGAMLFLNNSDVLSNTALFTGTMMPVNPPGGGGIYQQGAPLAITGGQVAYNAARALTGFEIAGGGIWNSGTANLNNTRVERNQADGTALAGVQAYGGGIYNENRVALTNNTRVSDNRAEAFFASGGGISSQNTSGGSAQLLVQDSVVSNNTAQGDIANGFAQGGGVHNRFGGTADLLSSDVRDNVASAGQSAQGGGIASVDTLTVTSSLVNSNAATVTAAFGSQGGGIFSLGNVALITGTQIHSNTAGTGGGWHNLVTGAQLINSDARFNQATAYDGGGVYNQGQDAQIVNSAVCQNQAQQHGGGVFNANTFFMAIQQSVVCDNQAGAGGTGDGGGVYNGASGGISIGLSQVLTNTAPDNGGGVYNAGSSANIFDSLLRANQATDGGGAYNAGAVMNVSASVVRDNQATNNGGGVYNATGANVNVFQSTLDSNSANAGGGLYNDGDATLNANAVINNTASATGGGAHNAGGTLSSVNNTFSGNSAPAGGGLQAAVGSSAYLTHTTIASNTGGNGINAAGGAVEVLATLLAYNTGSDCAGAITENGASMSSDASCSGFTFVSTNPLLQPLALNGGQTLNHALAPGSPALDQAPAPCVVSTDQRGVSRPQGIACDIGAFELKEANLQVSKSADPSTVIAGQTITYTVIVTNLSTTGAANSIVLTDTLLGGTVFGGVVSNGGFTLQSSTSSQALFTLASLPAGSSATLVFTATAPGSGPITNTVAVSSGNPDPDPSNNTDSISTPVTPVANLSISKAQSYSTN